MSAKKRSPITLFSWLSLLILVLASPGMSRETRQIYSEDEALFPRLGGLQADTVQVYYEDFIDGASGWAPIDLLEQDPFWHHQDQWGDTSGVMWCGLDDSTWVSPPGYGNNWDQSLSKTFLLPIAPPVYLRYILQYDTEPGCDFLYLTISADGGASYDTLETWDDDSGGFQTLSTDLSAYAGQEVILRFRFTSDSGWSDEDGEYDSDGGACITWVGVGDDWNSFDGGNEGWIASGLPAFPDLYRLEETPLCDPALPCDEYNFTWVPYPLPSALVGSYDTPGEAFGVAIRGSYAYVADRQSGLQVIDISDPAHPCSVGTYDTPSYAADVVISGDYAYVADWNGGLQVIDISDPANPTYAGSVSTPGPANDVAISDTCAYIADLAAGLLVIDVSDPTTPSLAGSCDAPNWAHGVAVSGNYAYIGDWDSGLLVIDISDPANPDSVGSCDTPGCAWGVAISGDYAYVADWGSGLQVIDISDPANPDSVGSYDTPGTAHNVAISGDYAYVADYESGLQVIDISNPASPTLEGSYDTPGYACGVAVSGNYAYVADDLSGLQVIDTSDPPAGVFPFECLYDRNLKLGIESPAIAIPDDADLYLLKFDVYHNLPLDNLVFYGYEVAAPPPEQGGWWKTDDYVYYDTNGFSTWTIDMTENIPPGTTDMKVRLYGIDLYYEWGGIVGSGDNHTSAPMFDNIGVYAVSGFVDPDGDGVPYPADVCPGEDASCFDSNGDGCVDLGAGGRHIEYWDRLDFPVAYVINEGGAPAVSDGSDFAAIQQAMEAWTAVKEVEARVRYDGTTAQTDAQSLDQVNLVTFDDPDYRFGVGVIAVELTTSFTEATEFNGRVYRPGQIVDADMIFNKAMSFRTVTDGPSEGIFIESVATHEAGHLFGISHSAVKTSTMYFVLGPGLEVSTLAPDDTLTMFKAYGSSLAMNDASHLYCSVIDGYSSNPIPGAAVFAISATSGDTLACEYTLPGQYDIMEFIGLPNDDYYIAVHPLDGSSAIGYTTPAHINDLIASTAVTAFIPEWWDAAESATDDPLARDPVTVTHGSESYVQITTNIDATAPVITSTVPAANATGVSVGASIMISFSEPIDYATLQGNFSLTDTVTSDFVSGNAAILRDDSLVAFVPDAGLAFSTTYRLRLDTGLQDRFGNGLAEPFEMIFATEPEPDVALTSLAPSKGAAGIIVSVNGKGFDPLASDNTVTFSGVPAAISKASPTQLVVKVPEGATSGVVHVYNHTQGQISNDLQFTVLSPDEVPKGFESGVTAASATPRAITVLPDGSYAYLATDAGAQAVVVDPALSGYMSAVTIPIDGGLNAIDASPAGNRVYGVSYAARKVYRIDSTPTSIGLLSEKAIGATPRGILVHPKGHRAFIPTYDGDIQIWDIDEASPSFESQVGSIIPPDPNIRGRLATDPAGGLLLALAGTGRLLVFELASNELVATVKVGPDPMDVAVDPMGRRAYVCDKTGVVSVVSLSDYVCLQNIRTGGTLRGIAVTPAGTFAHTVNRELNLLDAIDLRETSPTFRSVAATILLPINPVDIELSPDGDYALTISEAESRLIVTTVGLGPSLETLSRPAGPAGSELVIAGSDLMGDLSTSVSFGGIMAAPDELSDNALTVTVPAEAISGKVAVVTTDADKPPLTSNAGYFAILGPTVQDALRLAATLPGTPSPAADGGSILQVSPDGDYIALADRSGGFHVLVTNPRSSEYHKYIGSASLGSIAEDIVITQDGERAFVVLPEESAIRAIRFNRLQPDFLSTIGAVGLAGWNPAKVALSPDGSFLLASDPDTSQIHFVNIQPGSPTEYEIIASVGLAAGDVNGVVGEMAFHPSGAYAYLPVHDSDPAVVLVLDTAPSSPTYRSVVSTLTLPGTVPQEMPISLAFTPDGARCLVLTSQQVGAPNRSVVMLNTTDPESPAVSTTLPLGGTAAPSAEHITVSPRGDRAIVNLREAGLFNIGIQTSPDALSVVQQVGDPADHLTTVESGYVPDASNIYSLSESSDKLSVYDFSTVQTIAILSGNGQAGVVNEPLPKPLRVQVSGGSGSTAGIAVTFEVTAGGGRFAANNATTIVIATNSYGIAEVKWVLGDTVGPGSQTVEAHATGLTGSPLVFTADGLADPTTLPLTVSCVVPGQGATNVSVATATQTVFSRPVNPLSVNSSTFFLHEGGLNPVPAVIGFADGNRSVSLSPGVALKASTPYWIEMTTGILDEAGGALAQGVSSSFTTEPPPPVALKSVAPVSGTEGIIVVLSGTGFHESVALNKVLFNDLEAHVTEAGKDFINAIVPIGAVTGSVRAVNTAYADTSNALAFTVLPPAPPEDDNVVANVSTGSGAHGVAITPDGALAYAVSPFANRVVVIDLRQYASIASIAVGENPISITIDPEGAFSYVANYLDGTVSVIAVDEQSASFNEVVDAIPVGLGPLDLVITPDGDRLIVVNSASNDLSIVDTDSTSETYRSVIAGVSTGTGSNTVAITPDGGLIYVGTNNGYLIISALDYGVVAGVSTGSATSTVSITPDGAFLIVLTTEGVVNIYDIQEGSLTRNQVVATVQTGSGTATVAITPDGGLLYLIQESGDLIFVVALDISTVVGVVEHGADQPAAKLTATIVDTLTAGEDPSGIAFDPTGSGRFAVTNAGDFTVTIFARELAPATVAGYVKADCPQPGTGLSGIEVDAFRWQTGDLAATVLTDADGYYCAALSEGIYTLTVVTPLGYTIASEETLVTLTAGDTTFVDFALLCETATDARKMSYWKHQLGVALTGEGQAEVDGETLCEYLDRIEAHFNCNTLNPVVVYHPPASGECIDKLQVAKDVLNLRGRMDELAQARQELMALLFNVAAERLHLVAAVSTDGATLSKAITYVDRLIDDGIEDNDKLARKIARDVNHGKMIDPGVIPADTPEIFYTIRVGRCDLAQNSPNPFSRSTGIQFAVAEAVHVRLVIYDVGGRLVRTLVDEYKTRGVYRAAWDGTDQNGRLAASGVYFCRFQAGEYVKIRKMLLLK
jgi:YVTN family beta-propeller protein